MSVVTGPGAVAVAKRAVCWLDVFVFAIFVTASLSALSIADDTVTKQRRGLKPVKEHYELIATVPTLQASFTMAQDELKTLRGKLVELRMEARRLAADPASAQLDEAVKLKAARRHAADPASAQLDQAVKLKAAEAMIREYEAEVPRKSMATSPSATDAVGSLTSGLR
jgi:hypothetical protein